MNTIEQPREFSRRDVLKGFTAFAASQALSPLEAGARTIEDCAIPALDSIAKADDPTVELQSKLFADTEIVAITPEVAYSLTKVDLGAPKNPLQVHDPREWNYNSLSLVYSTAIQFPSHITGSHEGEYMQVAIENLKESKCKCSGVTFTDNDPTATHIQDVMWLGAHLLGA